MKYMLPPEWSKQSGILMAWPHANSYWDPVLAESERVFAEIIKYIADDQPVVLACHDRQYVLNYLSQLHVAVNNVHAFEIPMDDTWARDFGPITVFSNGKPVMLDFVFNAWGDKYAMPLDNLITKNLHAKGAFGETTLSAIDLVLEGGSIDVNGAGSLITTSRCLLDRHASFTEAKLEKQFSELFGLDQVIWLKHGYLAGDDTDAHIDTLVRFCDENTLCYQGCDDPKDDHYDELQAMAEELKTLKNSAGKPFKLVALPWMQPKMSRLTQDRLPASYANFLITNSKVLVPLYDDRADAAALKTIAQCFPTRKVVGINSLVLIENFGSIHCLTMQLPLGVVK